MWSVTSFNELAKEGRSIERENIFQAKAQQKESYVTQCLKNQPGPVIAATDYIRAYADQIRAFVPQSYTVLGTDGFGRSDTREQLREFFEVSAHYIILTALKSLVDAQQLSLDQFKQVMKKLGIDKDKPNPISV